MILLTEPVQTCHDPSPCGEERRKPMSRSLYHLAQNSGCGYVLSAAVPRPFIVSANNATLLAGHPWIQY